MLSLCCAVYAPQRGPDQAERMSCRILALILSSHLPFDPTHVPVSVAIIPCSSNLVSPETGNIRTGPDAKRNFGGYRVNRDLTAPAFALMLGSRQVFNGGHITPRQAFTMEWGIQCKDSMF